MALHVMGGGFVHVTPRERAVLEWCNAPKNLQMMRGLLASIQANGLHTDVRAVEGAPGMWRAGSKEINALELLCRLSGADMTFVSARVFNMSRARK